MFNVFVGVLACAALVDAVAIPRGDKTCLPPNAAAVKDFKPDKLFDGRSLYAIAGPPLPGSNITCLFISAKYDASSTKLAVTQNITINGNASTSTYQFTQDSDSNAVYNYEASGASTQLAVIDTDYTSYTVLTSCNRPGNKLAMPYVLAPSTQKPANYDGIVVQLATEGFPTDSKHLQLFDNSGCPKQ